MYYQVCFIIGATDSLLWFGKTNWHLETTQCIIDKQIVLIDHVRLNILINYDKRYPSNCLLGEYFINDWGGNGGDTVVGILVISFRYRLGVCNAEAVNGNLGQLSRHSFSPLSIYDSVYDALIRNTLIWSPSVMQIIPVYIHYKYIPVGSCLF